MNQFFSYVNFYPIFHNVGNKSLHVHIFMGLKTITGGSRAARGGRRRRSTQTSSWSSTTGSYRCGERGRGRTTTYTWGSLGSPQKGFLKKLHPPPRSAQEDRSVPEEREDPRQSPPPAGERGRLRRLRPDQLRAQGVRPVRRRRRRRRRREEGRLRVVREEPRRARRRAGRVGVGVGGGA